MGTCEPGQVREQAAISSHPHVQWVPRRRPSVEGEADFVSGGILLILQSTLAGMSDATPPRVIDAFFPPVGGLRRGRPALSPHRCSLILSVRSTPRKHSPMQLPPIVLVMPTYSPGARGVGKTSAARIFAKALNCENGPAPTPCNACEICQSISTGRTIVDVLENRWGQQPGNRRDSPTPAERQRSPKQNSLQDLHHRRSPHAHPRGFQRLAQDARRAAGACQVLLLHHGAGQDSHHDLVPMPTIRFAGIQTESIRGRLAQIAESEGVQADAEALDLLARRAAGSMRDAQSLLEQLLSFAPEKISATDVHSMLGTAGDERLHQLASYLVERNPAAALAELDAAAEESVDFALLLEQLFCYLRDAMAAAAGCSSDIADLRRPEPSRRSGRLGTAPGIARHTLAAMQILDQNLVPSALQYSGQDSCGTCGRANMLPGGPEQSGWADRGTA